MIYGKPGKKTMDRDEIIQEIYRSIRDAYNNFTFVFREKNDIILENTEERISVSFRIKREKKKEIEYVNSN
jgi:hypothetical protein